MISPELVSYIRKQTAAGVSKEAVAKSLILNGWSRQDIDQALAAIAAAAPVSLSRQIPRPSSPRMGVKLFISMVFIGASAVYAFFQYVANPAQSVSQQETPVSSSIPVSNQPVTETTPPPSVNTSTAVNQTSLATAPPPQQSSNPPSNEKVTQTTQPQVVTTPTPISAPAAKPAGEYADGSYTGDAANAYYGTVQVKAIIQNGALASVQFLQYPNDRTTSRYINSQAMPQLTSEAMQIQSANVDVVSGATFTSQAFQQSLDSALAQAKN